MEWRRFQQGKWWRFVIGLRWLMIDSKCYAGEVVCSSLNLLVAIGLSVYEDLTHFRWNCSAAATVDTTGVDGSEVKRMLACRGGDEIKIPQRSHLAAMRLSEWGGIPVCCVRRRFIVFPFLGLAG